MTLSPPELLTGTHRIDGFDCGKPALNDWLVTHALSNQSKGFSRVIVVCDSGRVAGFYSLAPTAVSARSAPRAIRTGRPPEPMPCILLGQMAVDRTYQGLGLGSALLRDAFTRALAAAQAIGGRALIVRAVDRDAEAYWRANGFAESRDDPSLLFRSMAAVAGDLEG